MDFIAEFKELLFKTPTYNLRTVHNTNCPYNHMLSYSKESFVQKINELNIKKSDAKNEIKHRLRESKKYTNWLPDVVGKID